MLVAVDRYVEVGGPESPVFGNTVGVYIPLKTAKNRRTAWRVLTQ